MTDLSPAAKAVLDAYENWSNSMTDHLITPPPELVEQWYEDGPGDQRELVEYVATQAARWGFDQRTVWDAEWLEVQLQRARDQELEACCEWLSNRSSLTERLRAAHRPKPLSLAEQALTLLDDASTRLDATHENTIRRALERLQELEGTNG